MKKGIIFLNFLLLLTLAVIGCNNNELKPVSPTNTTWLMKLAIDNQDYEHFSSLFSEGRKGIVSESEFSELKKMTSPGTEFSNYELLTFDNGQMLLVRLTPLGEDNIIEIEDVIVVPEDMKQLFLSLK